MSNLTLIPKHERDAIWEQFYADYSFTPSCFPNDWPSIAPAKPQLKFSIAHLFGDPYREEDWISLTDKGLQAFRTITAPQDTLIVLDWQHDCYYVNPHTLTTFEILADEHEMVVPSFIPNGDYFIFLTRDFENCWFGHPWEQTITLVGTPLIHAFQQGSINELFHIIRIHP